MRTQLAVMWARSAKPGEAIGFALKTKERQLAEMLQDAGLPESTALFTSQLSDNRAAYAALDSAPEIKESVHAALCAVAEAASIAFKSGNLHNGLRDENAMALFGETLSQLATIRKG